MNMDVKILSIARHSHIRRAGRRDAFNEVSDSWDVDCSLDQRLRRTVKDLGKKTDSSEDE